MTQMIVLGGIAGIVAIVAVIWRGGELNQKINLLSLYAVEQKCKQE